MFAALDTFLAVPEFEKSLEKYRSTYADANSEIIYPEGKLFLFSMQQIQPLLH